jgi:hypothetical protein
MQPTAEENCHDDRNSQEEQHLDHEEQMWTANEMHTYYHVIDDTPLTCIWCSSGGTKISIYIVFPSLVIFVPSPL